MSIKKKVPVKKCMVKTCTNKSNEGLFKGPLCFPCWDAITNPGHSTQYSAIYHQMEAQQPLDPQKALDAIWARLRKEVEDHFSPSIPDDNDDE